MAGKRCPRCAGKKHVFKIGSGYSQVDTGGPKVDCPLCLGTGEDKQPSYVEEAKERIKRKYTKKEKVDDQIDIEEAIGAETGTTQE